MKKVMIILGLASVLIAGCQEEEPPVTVKRMQLSYGYDSLVFTAYKPLEAKPVKVFYYIPEIENLADAPILFVFHGAERSGPISVSSWRSVAEDKGVILVGPQFTTQLYSSLEYQYGGVSYSSSKFVAKPEDQWTYQIVESLFDYIKEKTGNRTTTYDIAGHSAGGQFVHRYLLFMKDARVRRAIEANAGNYTVPDPGGVSDGTRTFGFPYSIYDVGLSREHLASYFARDMIVHLGKCDTVTSREVDSYLPVDAGSLAEGKCRFERGHFFYDRAKRVADSLGLPFNWRLIEVPGVGHSSSRMVSHPIYGSGYYMYND